MFCPKCGKEIADGTQCCPQCGNPVAIPVITPTPIYVQQAPQSGGCGKKLGCAVAVFLGLGMFGGFISTIAKSGTEQTAQADAGSSANSPDGNKAAKPTPVATETAQIPAKFEGDCGIAASAHMSTDIINHPKLKINVRNTAGKDIRAIQFLAIPYDVYGKEINDFIFTQERLYTDDLIPAGKSESMTFGPFLLKNIKSVKLYVYSVYFDDGTEWGDREAMRSEIIKFSKPIEATFEK